MMHTARFCLPIQKTKTSEIEELLMNENKRNEYTYFEIWLDLIKDLNETWIKKIVNDYDNSVIFLFRRPQLEKITMPIEQRKKIMNILSETNAFIDLDISQDEELNYLEQKQIKNLILSYHNYKNTPEEKDLEQIVRAMEVYQPTIYKIATTCLSEKDGLILMNLMEKLKLEKKKYIILGMGDARKIVRVYGMLYGNIITFAPRTLNQQSAAGQLTIDEMTNISDILKT